MTRIFFSYCNANSNIAELFKNKLGSIGEITKFEFVYSDTNSIDYITNSIYEQLNSANVILALITKEYLESINCIEELTIIKAYVKESKNNLLIPVVIGAPLSKVERIMGPGIVLTFSQNDIENAIERTKFEVLNRIGKLEANKAKRVEEIKRIQDNSEEYIEDALKTLKEREVRNRRYATVCYVMGYVTLACGVGFGIFNLEKGEDLLASLTWYQCIYVLTKGLILIGFLVACSKYVFNLGKAYMNESLKNADRMHAISFGKFYLKGYGEKATWSELKEVFQHWNLDKNSFFTNLDSNEFDPKIKELISVLNKAIPIKK